MGRISPPVVIALAALAVLFGALAAWQYARAGEKAALEADDARRASLAPVWIHSGEQLHGMWPGRGVKLCGAWLADSEVVLDNRPHEGRPGYQVFAPMRLRDGSGVAAFRGWMPAAADRGRILASVPGAAAEEDIPGLPGAEIAACPYPARVVYGRLWRPDRRPFARDEAARDAGPWLEQDLQLQRLAGRIGLELPPLVIWPDWPRPGLEAIPRPPPSAMTSDRHRGYALTWLLLCLTAVAVGVGLFLRMRAGK